jgi:2-C-methyl-D-erythritol 4-phosphate cytidylyltransferase
LNVNAGQERFDCVALVPAGGVGARFGASVPKQYVEIAGRTVLEHSLLALLSASSVQAVYLAVQSDDERAVELLQSSIALKQVTLLKCAGESRRDTVLNALNAIRSDVKRDAFVLVHDAARPCLQQENIETLIHVAGGESIGGLLAIPVTDTVKRTSSDGKFVETISREGLWRAQTPQMFRYETLVHALIATPDATDEAQAIEALGLNPVLVHGDTRNIKITIAEDADIAELFLRSRQDDELPTEFGASL